MVMYLADSKLTPRHFYKGLLEQLGCEAKFYRGDAKRQLHKEIELMKGIHKLQPVVIVDEAHLLDREMLEEVRFLLNFKMDAQSPMALVLVGQNELWERLKLQSYAAIRQRIDLICRLPHLDRAEVGAYIKRHLEYAGADHDIFSDNAIDEILSSPVEQQGWLTRSALTACFMGRRTIGELLMITWSSWSFRESWFSSPCPTGQLLDAISVNFWTTNAVYCWILWASSNNVPAYR